MKDTDQTIQGVAPSYQLVSDFQYGECGQNAGAVLNGVTPNAITLQVPANMTSRKIYAWLYCANSSSNYYVTGTISFYKGSSFLGSLPLSIGGGTFGNASLVAVCTSNGQNVQDCLGVCVANPTGSQPTSLVLQPLYINGQFDIVTFNITGVLGITSIRALLACISST